jgi:hypothetical protein
MGLADTSVTGEYVHDQLSEFLYHALQEDEHLSQTRGRTKALGLESPGVTPVLPSPAQTKDAARAGSARRERA